MSFAHVAWIGVFQSSGGTFNTLGRGARYLHECLVGGSSAGSWPAWSSAFEVFVRVRSDNYLPYGHATSPQTGQGGDGPIDRTSPTRAASRWSAETCSLCRCTGTATCLRPI